VAGFKSNCIGYVTKCGMPVKKKVDSGKLSNFINIPNQGTKIQDLLTRYIERANTKPEKNMHLSIHLFSFIYLKYGYSQLVLEMLDCLDAKKYIYD